MTPTALKSKIPNMTWRAQCDLTSVHVSKLHTTLLAPCHSAIILYYFSSLKASAGFVSSWFLKLPFLEEIYLGEVRFPCSDLSEHLLHWPIAPKGRNPICFVHWHFLAPCILPKHLIKVSHWLIRTQSTSSSTFWTAFKNTICYCGPPRALLSRSLQQFPKVLLKSMAPFSSICWSQTAFLKWSSDYIGLHCLQDQT